MAAMLSEPARLMSPSPSALDLCEYDYDFDFYPPAVGAAASAASTPRTLHPSNTNAKNQNQNTNADPGSRLINNGNGNGNVNTARPLKLGSLAFPESLPLPLPLSTPSSSSAATVTVYANTHTHTSTNPNPARKPLPTRPSTTPSTTPAITAGPGKTTASSSSSSTATTASLAKPTRPPPPKRVLSSFMPPSLPSSHNHNHNHKGKPTLLLLLTNPPVLSQLLAHLPWTSTWPLLNTCKTTRHGVFSDPALRDEVLVRYVTGYKYAMGMRDERFFKDVKVSVGDLDLLLISQKYPLHQYPTHALRLLSSLYPTLEDDEKTAKLVALTQAHSRFVLLLQSLVHSSCEPLAFDAEEGFALGDRERLGRGERKWRARSRFAPLPLPLSLPLPMAHNAPLTQTLRELTFPAPLAYTQPNVHVEKQPRGEVSSASKTQKGRGAGTIRSKSVTTNTRHKHSLSQPQVVTTSTLGAHATELEELGFSIARHNAYAYTYGGPSPSANRLSSLAMISSSSNTRKGRRLSIFSKTPPPPPPPEEPKTLKIYASTWRRRTRRDSRSVDFGMVSGSGALRIPERRFATEAGGNGSGSNDASSDSSMSAATASAPPSIAGRDTPLSSSFHGSGSGSGSGFGSGFTHSTASSTSSSPHDLTLATRRTRAPILRVFVPCTKLDDGDGDEDESASIVQCEKQLEEAGLWTHLSTGDVVCNLGYIPPIGGGGGGGDDSSSLDRDRFDEEMMRIPMSVLQGDHHHNYATGGSDFLMRGFSGSTDTSPRGSTFGSGNSAHGQGQGQPQAKWLLFNGQFLIPYTPPDLLPLDDPLSLPSPYYYAHITPSPPPPHASHTHIHASRLHPAHALASSNLITNITANPTFVIPRFPLCDDVPQLRLVHTTSKVPSPHSPSGYALVRRWAWTARVVRVRHSSPPSSSSSSGLYSGSGLGPSTVGGGMVGGIGTGGAGEMGMGMGMGTEDAGNLGEGWYGEWILEYEGTKEGKQVLLHALAGKMLGRRVWELVREKCGPGRIWLRLLPT